MRFKSTFRPAKSQAGSNRTIHLQVSMAGIEPGLLPLHWGCSCPLSYMLITGPEGFEPPSPALSSRYPAVRRQPQHRKKGAFPASVCPLIPTGTVVICEQSGHSSVRIVKDDLLSEAKSQTGESNSYFNFMRVAA